MKLIPLTQGKFAQVDDEDYEHLSQWKWFADRHKRKNIPDRFRACRKMSLPNGKQKTILMHREITNAEKGFVVDHINHDELDNRKDNLRVCEQYQNCCNKIVTLRTLPRGVCFCEKNKKFLAQITVKQKNKHLGYFSDPSIAAKAYRDAQSRYHGEFRFKMEA